MRLKYFLGEIELDNKKLTNETRKNKKKFLKKIKIKDIYIYNGTFLVFRSNDGLLGGPFPCIRGNEGNSSNFSRRVTHIIHASSENARNSMKCFE